MHWQHIVTVQIIKSILIKLCFDVIQGNIKPVANTLENETIKL